MQDFSGKSNYLSSSVKFFPNFCSSVLNIKGMTVNNSSTANTVNVGYYCLLKVKIMVGKSQMMFGIRKFSYLTTLFKP